MEDWNHEHCLGQTAGPHALPQLLQPQLHAAVLLSPPHALCFAAAVLLPPLPILPYGKKERIALNVGLLW